ncbi:Detected protein of unknown function [Hibiscus syriacus]|uniref:Uncharacterized protein n=1 Tax=Hibiscus syriacus TaxID=106335 RepID=A0A6A3D1I6_HIBSY|nr:Detected protein of unknown function [Hibiscus syriacus]
MNRQGQGNSSNPFQIGNFDSNGDVGSDQHNVVPDGHTSKREIGQTSSGIDTQNHIVTTQRSEPRFNPLIQNNNRVTDNGPIEPSVVADSVPLQHSFDASKRNGPYISLHLLRAGATTGGDNIQNSSGSSSPVMIHSGVAGYVIEENISPDGLPVDGKRRLLSKRKALELGSSFAREAQNSQQERTIAQDNVSILNVAANSFNDHSRLGAALLTSCNLYQIPIEARQVDNFQRNLWTWNSRNSNAQPTGQLPFILTSSVPAPVLVNSTVQPTVQVPNSSQALQHYWNGTNLSWVGCSSVSLDHTANVRETLQQEENLGNNTRNNMIISSVNVPTNMNSVNENTNASSLRIQEGLNMHLPNSSISSSSPNTAAQYGQRRRDIVISLSDSWRRESLCPILPGASPDAQDIDVSIRGGNARPAHVHPSFSRRVEIQAHRRRLVHGAFRLVRMPGDVRLEDVMVINPSYLYGIPEDPDIIEDMRLDIDNMSYVVTLKYFESNGNYLGF